MAEHRIFTMAFSKVYPMYVQKAQRKNRSKDEVDRIIRWLTGYDQARLSSTLLSTATLQPSLPRRPPFIRMHRSSRASCAVFVWRTCQTR